MHALVKPVLIFVCFFSLGLIYWEASVQSQIDEGNHTRTLPSVVLYRWCVILRIWTEALGFWVARVFNPLYWLEHFFTYFRPYVNAVKRLLKAVVPMYFTGYYFLKGFFTEYYGWLAIICLPLLTAAVIYRTNCHVWIQRTAWWKTLAWFTKKYPQILVFGSFIFILGSRWLSHRLHFDGVMSPDVASGRMEL